MVEKPFQFIHLRKLHVHLVTAGFFVAGLEWPRGFQEIKVPKFHDNGTGWW